MDEWINKSWGAHTHKLNAIAHSYNDERHFAICSNMYGLGGKYAK